MELFYCSCIIYNFLVCYLYCSIVLLLLLVFINYTDNLHFAIWSFLVHLLAFRSVCILLVCLRTVFKATVSISSHHGAAGSSSIHTSQELLFHLEILVSLAPSDHLMGLHPKCAKGEFCLVPFHFHTITSMHNIYSFTKISLLM